MRRGHDSLDANTLAINEATGETHLRHHVTESGYYRGRKILKGSESE